MLLDMELLEKQLMANNLVMVGVSLVVVMLDFDNMVGSVHDKFHFPLDLSEAKQNLVAVETLLVRNFAEMVQIVD